MIIIRLLHFGNISNIAENLYLGALGMKLMRYVLYIYLQILLEANNVSRLEIHYHFQLSDLKLSSLAELFSVWAVQKKIGQNWIHLVNKLFFCIDLKHPCQITRKNRYFTTRFELFLFCLVFLSK